jgi:nicotinate-nucleotide adenylyltransferase
MRIAIFGGTFSPIHYGHLRIAEEVREILGFEKIVFIPVNTPPHKEDPALISPWLRLEMIKLAIEGNPSFEASDIEIKRGGKSFTIDTVTELSKQGFDTTVIVGSDLFNDITTWCEYERLLECCDFAVVARPGAPAKKIAQALPVELAKKFCYDEKMSTDRASVYASSFGRRVVYVESTLLDISASAVRGMVKDGSSIRYLVHPAVEDYIGKKGLYRG